jgi:hypothetical protein
LALISKNDNSLLEKVDTLFEVKNNNNRKQKTNDSFPPLWLCPTLNVASPSPSSPPAAKAYPESLQNTTNHCSSSFFNPNKILQDVDLVGGGAFSFKVAPPLTPYGV